MGTGLLGCAVRRGRLVSQTHRRAHAAGEAGLCSPAKSRELMLFLFSMFFLFVMLVMLVMMEGGLAMRRAGDDGCVCAWCWQVRSRR